MAGSSGKAAPKMHLLKNSLLQVKVKEQGAELCSLYSSALEHEFLWQADPNHWSRHAPVLFPIVGRLKDDRYLFSGRSYTLPQHGFARDQNFTLEEKSDKKIRMFLEHNAGTLEHFPFMFRLSITYLLENDTLHISWQVENKDRQTMHFSIGAHPG